MRSRRLHHGCEALLGDSFTVEHLARYIDYLQYCKLFGLLSILHLRLLADYIVKFDVHELVVMLRVLVNLTVVPV